MAETQQAVVYDLSEYRKRLRPTAATEFCNNVSLLQTIEKLAERIHQQYSASVGQNLPIDEDAAALNEHIIDLIRTKHSIPTDQIHHHLQVAFNLRVSQQPAKVAAV